VTEADDNAVIGLMIEDREAVEQAEALLSVPGVDLAFVGRADLSLSMLGRLDPNDPVVVDATRHVVEVCRHYGVAPMTYVECVEQVSLYYEMGVQLLNLTADTVLWLTGCQEAVRTFTRLVPPHDRG